MKPAMNCVEREKLFAYVHRMLEPREEGEVRAHVTWCPACSKRVEEFQKLDVVLDEWKPTKPSAWFDARVRAAVAAAEPAENPGFFFGLRRRRWLSPALLVVLVVSASWVVLRTGRSPHPAPFASRRQAAQPAAAVGSKSPQAQAEEELSLYKDLPVLEDYDMLANFDMLSELPKGDKRVAD